MSKVITEPSICIPRTLNNITWRQVKDTFEQILGQGTVERVDLVGSKNGDPFCRIFIHFRYWPTDESSQGIRERLIAGETIKVVYDNPWFWKCSASRIPKPVKKDYDKPKSVPYIEIENISVRSESPLPLRPTRFKTIIDKKEQHEDRDQDHDEDEASTEA